MTWSLPLKTWEISRYSHKIMRKVWFTRQKRTVSSLWTGRGRWDIKWGHGKGSVLCEDDGIKVKVTDVDEALFGVLWKDLISSSWFLIISGSHFMFPSSEILFPGFILICAQIRSDSMRLGGNLRLRRWVLLCLLFPSKAFALNLYESLTGIFSNVRGCLGWN